MSYGFKFSDIDDLEFEYTDQSVYTYQGKPVPRVTSILSKMIHEDFLMYWSNNLGLKHQHYKTVLNEAAKLGSKAHKGFEIFLKEGTVNEDAPFFPMKAFLSWWNNIRENNKVEILGQEHPLVCPYYGGTYDLLLSINGDKWLVDFKTSNKVTYKYFLQLAAYNRILRDYENTRLSGVMILQVEKERPIYHEYFLDFKNIQQKEYFNICERTFLSLLYGYYHILYLERGFSHVVQK